MRDFGTTLKDLRTKKGITQIQLADMIYVNHSSISKYESNSVSPTLEVVQAIARVFNVSMDYLMGMEKAINISTVKLTPEQIQIMRDLAEAFRNKPTAYPKKINAEQQRLIGRIAIEFEK